MVNCVQKQNIKPLSNWSFSFGRFYRRLTYRRNWITQIKYINKRLIYTGTVGIWTNAAGNGRIAKTQGAENASV